MNTRSLPAPGFERLVHEFNNASLVSRAGRCSQGTRDGDRFVKRAKLPSMRCRERGIASIEAVIMLPLMIIVFAGVLYVAKLVSAAQHTTRNARSCAWQVAVSGCGEAPPECPESSNNSESETKSRLDEAGGPSSIDLNGLAAEEGAENDERTNNVLADIGARLNEFLLDRYESRFEEEFEKSQILGGETVTIDKSFSLPCNSKPSAAEGLADALFDDFSPPEKTPEPGRYKDPNDPDSDDS